MTNFSGIEIPTDLIAFFRDLSQSQAEASGKVDILLDNASVSRGNDQRNNFPLIDTVEPEIDPEQYLQQFRESGDILVRHRPERINDVASAAELLLEIDVPKLIRNLCKRDGFYVDKISAEAKNASIFKFLAENALKPFLITYCGAVKNKVDTESRHPVCPVCGRTALFSRLQGEDGQRLMYCQFCRMEWYGKYLTCSHCGNDDHQTLSYITPEGDPALQVFVCQKCKGYLKTYDERKGKNCPELPLADILTLHLDLLAEREGYSNQGEMGSGIH